MIKQFILLFLILAFSPLKLESKSRFDKDSSSTANTHTFYGGLRFQKAVGFYWFNGLSLEYTNTILSRRKVSLSLNFISSKLGTAAFSNAIPCYEINVSVTKYFRFEKSFKPLLRLNTGYAHSNYGSDEFEGIQNQSLTVSLETGAAYDFKAPVRLVIGLGYNFITGNGMEGLGTLYPVYGQFSVLYKIK